MKRITGALALYALGFLCIIGISVSCGSTDCTANPKDPACVAKSVGEDCTASSVADAIAKYGPQVEGILTSTPRNPDGSVNYTAILSAVEQDVASAGMCAIAEIFSKYVFAAAPSTPRTAASSPTPTPDEAKTLFDKLRAEHAPGKTFKTSKGTL